MDNSFSSLTQSPNDKLDTFAVPFVLQLQAKRLRKKKKKKTTQRLLTRRQRNT